MAKLINGNGNKAIWSAQDADLIASICGNVTAIAAVGSQFNYTQEDANTIGVADGVIITKEGRRIQLDSGSVDLFTIPTGQLNVTSYYIIGYKLVQNSDTTQTCETFVQKMDNATDVITEDTFKGGSTEVYVSLYRVTQVGMNIDTVDLLLPSMKDLSELSNDLGNLSNLDTTDKTSLVNAINEVASGETGFMPKSGTTTQVADETGQELSYTIPADGWYQILLRTGTAAASQNNLQVKCGNLTFMQISCNVVSNSANSLFKFKQGTVITTSGLANVNTARCTIYSVTVTN